MKRKFEGQFEALVREGAEYENRERFTPLSGSGKPLWEFKEHDHRIYCERREFPNGSIQVILLHGWTKDKKGRSREEGIQIEVALGHRQERLNEEPKT